MFQPNLKALIGVIFTLCLLSSCSHENKNEKNTKEIIPRLVKTITIDGNEQHQLLSYPARVGAGKKVDLSFNVSGQLVEFPVKEGQKFKKGDILAKIDPTEFKIDVDRQMAKYIQAKAMYERYAKLLPQDAISKADYDEKKSIYLLQKANLDQAEKALKDTVLIAPFSGIVANRYVEHLEQVQAKQKILSLQDNENIEIIAEIPEQIIANSKKVKTFQNESLGTVVGYAEFPNISQKKFPLTLKEVRTEADAITQTYRVIFAMNQPDTFSVLPGMNVTVYLYLKHEGSSIFIPIEAVVTDAKGQKFVWLINPKTMKVQKQFVTVGEIKKDEIQVLSGLKQEDQIVSVGASLLYENDLVKIYHGKIEGQSTEERP